MAVGESLIVIVVEGDSDSDSDSNGPYISDKPKPKAYVARVRKENTSWLDLQVQILRNRDKFRF